MQGQTPQASEQGNVAGQQGRHGAYPSNPIEAVRFANNIMEEIYRGGADGPNITAILNMPENASPEKSIGLLAGKIVGDMLGQLRSTGKRPAMKLALGAVKKTVEELIEISQAAGKEISLDIVEPAMAIATNVIDEMGSNRAKSDGKMRQNGSSPQQESEQGGLPAMPPSQGGA